MNCPNCGKEMEEGYLCSHKYPTWTKAGIPVLRMPKDGVILRPLGDDFEGRLDFELLHEFPHTMLCRACKTIVLQYN